MVAHAQAYFRSDTPCPPRHYGPENKLWQANEIAKPVGMVESGLVYSSGENYQVSPALVQ